MKQVHKNKQNSCIHRTYLKECRKCKKNGTPQPITWKPSKDAFKLAAKKAAEPIPKGIDLLTPRSKICFVCNIGGRGNYEGIDIDRCMSCFREWLKSAPCVDCGQPVTEKKMETLDEDDELYIWHFSCWYKALSQEQRELMEMLQPMEWGYTTSPVAL